MSRPDRWWRPSTTRRPAQRARTRRMYTGSELDKTFNIGYTVGQADEAKRSENRDRQISRLMEAIDAVEQGDPRPLEEIAREAAGDDFLEVADAAGVTPLADAGFEDELVPEIEAWLRDQVGEA